MLKPALNHCTQARERFQKFVNWSASIDSLVTIFSKTGLISRPCLWSGMVAHNYEKFILVFGGHERPHLTKDNHIKNNEKRKWDAYSRRFSLFVYALLTLARSILFQYSGLGLFLGSRDLSHTEMTIWQTLFSCNKWLTLMTSKHRSLNTASA